MTDASDITGWIDGVRRGDSLAAHRLWTAYFDKLTRLARQHLQGARTTAVDEEDIALSALKSFCLAAQQGRFEQLTNRESLWPLLVSITANKSVDAIRFENRKKRGGSGDADNATMSFGRRLDSNDAHTGLTANDFLDQGPTPEFAAELTDQFHALIRKLDSTGDEQLREIAISKMQGDSTTEIATQLDCARRTVERKLQLIRRILIDSLATDDRPESRPNSCLEQERSDES